MLSLKLPKKIAKINSSVESDPMIFSVKNQTRSDEVFGE